MLRFNGRSDRVKHRTEVLFISVLQHVLDITVIVMSFLLVMIGVMVGMTFKLTTIQTASVGITAALAVLFVQYIGGRLKEYSIVTDFKYSFTGYGRLSFIAICQNKYRLTRCSC